jgi:hypothetical protein
MSQLTALASASVPPGMFSGWWAPVASSGSSPGCASASSSSTASSLSESAATRSSAAVSAAMSAGSTGTSGTTSLSAGIEAVGIMPAPVSGEFAADGDTGETDLCPPQAASRTRRTVNTERGIEVTFGKVSGRGPSPFSWRAIRRRRWRTEASPECPWRRGGGRRGVF